MKKTKHEPNCINSDIRHYKSFDEAALIIWNYAAKFNNLAKWNGAGVEIGRNQLNKILFTDQHCGLMAYFCCDNSDFYLAYNAYAEIDPNNVWPIPDDDTNTYYYSKDTFVFEDEDIADQNSIWQALAIYNNPINDSADQANIDDINVYSDVFNRKFPYDLVIPVGFFHKYQIKKVLEQNDGATGDQSYQRCAGLRLYFGREVSSDQNNIKLVIFGVNQDGYNILRTYDNEPAKIIEKSWPPN